MKNPIVISICTLGLLLSACAQVPIKGEYVKPTGKMCQDILPQFVGLSVSEGEGLALKHGMRTRITKVNGESRVITMDVVETRVNFQLENNTIVHASCG